MQIFIALIVIIFLGLFVMLSLPLAKDDSAFLDDSDTHSTRPTRDA